jgi:hypothetical protein
MKKNDQSSRRHGILPVWKKEIDREGIARAMLLLAMHLDEQDRMAHKNQQNPAEGTAGQKGGGHDDHE